MEVNPALGVLSNRLCAMDALTRALFDRIAKEIALRSQVIVESKATSFEDYKAKTHYVMALKDVMAWGTEIADKANSNFQEPPSPLANMRAGIPPSRARS